MNSPDEPLEVSDARCVEHSRDGSPEDFRLLVQRYQRPLFAFLAGRLGNASEAEEAAQESFVRAFLSLKKLRKPESFYAWLLGIACRVTRERFRDTKRREQVRAVAETLQAAAESGPAAEYPLEEVIAALPESYRRVILLRYYEGLSCLEMAERLAMPLGTVTKTLSRAYALLRQELRACERAEQSVNNTLNP
ncbi:MAG: sigma-70 family RNA polymerase sigma factor [Verrucomicrobiota bacterium]|jgi:RNA polymerase sigma-70 factor (ECF subfamily)